MHGGYSEVNIDCIKMLLIISAIQIQFIREKYNVPYVFDSYVSPKNTKTLAPSMCSGLCHTQLNALDFFQDNSLQDRSIYAPINFTSPNTTSVSVICVWVLLRMKTFLHLRRRFSNKHWKLVISMFHIHDDAWAALWRTKWHQDYYSSCHSQAKICFG